MLLLLVWYLPSFLFDLGETVLLLRKELVVEKLFPLLVELRELLCWVLDLHHGREGPVKIYQVPLVLSQSK